MHFHFFMFINMWSSLFSLKENNFYCHTHSGRLVAKQIAYVLLLFVPRSQCFVAFVLGFVSHGTCLTLFPSHFCTGTLGSRSWGCAGTAYPPSLGCCLTVGVSSLPLAPLTAGTWAQRLELGTCATRIATTCSRYDLSPPENSQQSLRATWVRS